MTLILTALCKNGVCVCADRRFQIKHSNGSTENNDTYRKLYKFANNSLIIYNHGVNKFNNKYWDTYCFDYEQSNRWMGKNLRQIADDFKSYIEEAILLQLRLNIQNMPTLIGVDTASFVLCGKTEFDIKYEFHELFWSPSFNLSSWNDTRLIGSGEGYKRCLHNYLLKQGNSDRVNSIEFWGSINTDEAQQELVKLFNIAVSERIRLGGDDFSDQFDIDCVSE